MNEQQVKRVYIPKKTQSNGSYRTAVNGARNELLALGRLRTSKSPDVQQVLVESIMYLLGPDGLEGLAPTADAIKRTRRSILDLFQAALESDPSFQFVKRKILRIFGYDGLERFVVR